MTPLSFKSRGAASFADTVAGRVGEAQSVPALLPVLLLGVTDEAEPVRSECMAALEAFGALHAAAKAAHGEAGGMASGSTGPDPAAVERAAIDALLAANGSRVIEVRRQCSGAHSRALF